MKWSEFKRQVEEKLKEAGTEDGKINFIDIGVSYHPDDIIIIINNQALEIFD